MTLHSWVSTSTTTVRCRLADRAQGLLSTLARLTAQEHALVQVGLDKVLDA